MKNKTERKPRWTAEQKRQAKIQTKYYTLRTSSADDLTTRRKAQASALASKFAAGRIHIAAVNYDAANLYAI